MQDYIGIAVWNYCNGSLAERIDRFAEMGFNAVSLIGREARILADGGMPDVEEAILKHSLTVTVHANFPVKDRMVDGGPMIEDFERILKWHERTKSLNTVNFDAASYRLEDGTQVYMGSEMHDILSTMLSLSEDTGITVGVEDWPRNEEHLQAVSDLQSFSHFGMLIDLGHLNIRVRKGLEPEAPFPVAMAQAYLDSIVLPVNELHIHNNNGIKDLHAPPSDGNSDIPAIVSMLKRKGVDCVSTIEIAPSFCGMPEDLATAAAKESLDLWRSLMFK